MALMPAESLEYPGNPIDMMEDLVRENQWMCDRASDDELLVEVSGRWCDYRMFFVWREQVKALYFTCSLDMKVVPEKRREINDLLSQINERMWFGHFELCSEAGTPMFRHTMLTRGWGRCQRRATGRPCRNRGLRMRTVLPGVPIRSLGRIYCGKSR